MSHVWDEDWNSYVVTKRVDCDRDRVVPTRFSPSLAHSYTMFPDFPLVNYGPVAEL